MERLIDENALRTFAVFLVREEREKSTQEAYLRHVRRFSAWLAGRPADKELTMEWKAAQQRRNGIVLFAAFDKDNIAFRRPYSRAAQRQKCSCARKRRQEAHI